MNKHNEQSLVESMRSLREAIILLEGPFAPVIKPALDAVKPALSKAMDYGTKYAKGAMAGYKAPARANLNPNSKTPTMAGTRLGADVKGLVNNPNARAAGAAGAAGAATLGGGAALLNPDDAPPIKSTPQDMSTHGTGYLDDTNPGYKYHPYNDPDEHSTVIGIDGDDEGPGTVIGIDGKDDIPQLPASGNSPMPKHPAHPSHPAGKAPSTKPKFDPAIQKQQYELRAKGYPVKTNGILDNATIKAIEWERLSSERDSRITGYDELKANMDQTITPPEPFDNTQGDFDRMPELNESVELQRIMQIAQWK